MAVPAPVVKNLPPTSSQASRANQEVLDAAAVPGSTAQQLIKQERWLAAIDALSVKDEVVFVASSDTVLGRIATNSFAKVLDSQKLKGLDIRGADFSDFYIRTKSASGDTQDISLAGKILSADLDDRADRLELAAMLEGTVFNKTTRFHQDDRVNKQVFEKLKALAQQFTDQSTQPSVNLNGMAVLQSTPLRHRTADKIQSLETIVDKQAALVTGNLLNRRQEVVLERAWRQKTSTEIERLQGRPVTPYESPSDPITSETFTPLQSVTCDAALLRLKDAYAGADPASGTAHKAVVAAFAKIPDAAVRAEVLESLAKSQDTTHTAILNALVIQVGTSDHTLEQVLRNYTEDARNSYRENEYAHLPESGKSYVRERLRSITTAPGFSKKVKQSAGDLLESLEPQQKLSTLVSFYLYDDSVTDSTRDPNDASVIQDRALKAQANVHGRQIEPANYFKELYKSLSIAQQAQVKREVTASHNTSAKATLLEIIGRIDAAQPSPTSAAADAIDYQVGAGQGHGPDSLHNAMPTPKIVRRSPPQQASSTEEDEEKRDTQLELELDLPRRGYKPREKQREEKEKYIDREYSLGR